MSRACAIHDEQLLAFAEGEAFDLDEHVAGCDDCQEFLATLWDGGLDHDLSEPVVQAIRFELFMIDVARLMADVMGDMGRAAKVYFGGAEE